MKEPSLPYRQRRQSSMQKLKLLCSFKGAFRPCPPSGTLRYVSGESRIISIDRSSGISHLRSQISALCPENHFLALKYQLLVVPGLLNNRDGPPLVSLITDDDVRYMLEKYDRALSVWKNVRLRVFVIHSENGYVGSLLDCSTSSWNIFDEKGSAYLPLSDNALESRFPSTNRFLGFCNMGDVCRLNGLESKIATTQTVGVQSLEDPFCQMACRPQFLTNGLAGIPKSRDLLASDASKHGIGSTRPSLTSARPPIPITNMSRNHNFEADSCVANSLRSPEPIAHVNQARHSGGSRPLLEPQSRSSSSRSSEGLARESKPFLGHANEGKMKDWVGQLTATGLPVDPFSFQGGSHETTFEISNLHKNGFHNHDAVWNGSSFCHMSNLCPPRAEKELQCLGETIVWKNTDRGNLFSSSNPFLGAYRCGSGNQATCKPHCHDLSLALSPNASLNEGNFDVGVMQTYSVSNAQRQDVAVPSYSEDQGQNTWFESITNMISPLHDWDLHLGPLSEIHKKTLVKDLSSKHNGHHSETPLDHSVHNLSLLSLTVATVTASSGDDLEINGGDYRVYDQNNSNGTETLGCHNALWDCKMKTQCDEMDQVASSIELLSKDRAENGKCRRDDDHHWTVLFEASFKDVPGLGSSLKSSEDLYQYEVQRSCTKVDNISSGREKKQRALSKPGMEEEANGESSACHSEVVDQPRSEIVRICSCLAARELQTIQNSDLEEIRELGFGTYGTVFYGKWKGSDVAIKRIKSSCFKGGGPGEDQLIANFWKEANLLSQLQHPNVVAFYGVVKDGTTANFAAVMEYMVNGSLKQVLQRKDRTIDRRKRLIIAMDAAFGMEYLHDKNVVHFDLKSHNLLVNMKDPQRPICKIGDLGLAKMKQSTLVSGGVRGTIPWMAPELLTADKSTMVTEKVDVYSFGIVMWELLNGEEPYADVGSEEMIAGIIKGTLRPKIPSWCDPAWSSLIERCWSSDPSSRPSFSEIAKELRSMSASMKIK